MSACNTFYTKREAYIVTDSVFYEYDGTVLGYGNKQLALPQFRSVLTGRGNFNYMMTAFMAICAGGMVGDSIDAIDLRAAMAAADEAFPEPEKRFVELTLIGWSDLKGGIDCQEWHRGRGEAAFRRIERHPLSASFAPGIEGLKVPQRFERDPVAAMTEITKQQRDWCAADDPACVIGGAIVGSVVTQRGVETKVTHRFPVVAAQHHTKIA